MAELYPTYAKDGSNKLHAPRAGDTFIDEPDVSFDNISDLTDYKIGQSPRTKTANVMGYYSAGDGGGGTFYWDSSEDKANHNGGTIINPDHNSTIGSDNWYSASGDSTDTSGSGCWVRPIDSSFIEVLKFGVKQDNSSDNYNQLKNSFDFVKRGIIELPTTDNTTDNSLGLGQDLEIPKEKKIKGVTVFGSPIDWVSVSDPSVAALVSNKNGSSDTDYIYSSGIEYMTLRMDGASNGIDVNAWNEDCSIKHVKVVGATGKSLRIGSDRSGSSPNYSQNFEVENVQILPRNGIGVELDCRYLTFNSCGINPQGGYESNNIIGIVIEQGRGFEFNGLGFEDMAKPMRIGTEGNVLDFSIFECVDNTPDLGTPPKYKLLDFEVKESVDGSQTTISVSNDYENGFSASQAEDLPSPPFTVIVDDEQMKVVNVDESGGSIVVERGVNGTTSTTHADGSTISVYGSVTFWVGNPDQTTGGANTYKIERFRSNAGRDYLVFDSKKHLFIKGRGFGTDYPLEILSLEVDNEEVRYTTSIDGFSLPNKQYLKTRSSFNDKNVGRQIGVNGLTQILGEGLGNFNESVEIVGGAEVIANEDKSIGNSVTLSVNSLDRNILSGKKLYFESGGVFELTSTASKGDTSITGDLTESSIRSGDKAVGGRWVIKIGTDAFVIDNGIAYKIVNSSGNDATIAQLTSSDDVILGDSAGRTSRLRGYAGGNQVIQADSDSTSGNTRFILYDVDSGQLQRVKAGGNNTGPSSTGRALYIDNV